jgi:pectinesterase
MNSHPGLVALGMFLLLAASVPAAPGGVIRFPANKATGVNPDTHLVLTFPIAPTQGNAGKIRVYDAANDRIVDTLDLSIPAGPSLGGRGAAPGPTGGMSAAAVRV